MGACLQVLVQAPCVLGKLGRIHARGALRRQLLGSAVGARRPEGAVRLQAALLQRCHDWPLCNDTNLGQRC